MKLKTKTVELLVVLLLPMLATGVQVADLPVCEYADTEVATNVPFQVRLEDMSRIEVSLSLIATPTNVVEVAIGADANGDGELSFDEAAWAFGYLCGTWFSLDVESDVIEQNGTVTSFGSRVEKTFVLKKTMVDSAWNLVRVVRRGEATIGERVEVVGRKFGAAIIVW